MGSLKIRDAAKILGVHENTLRRWERIGILSPKRGWNRYRLFGEADLRQARGHMRKRQREIQGGVG